jgi:hypothetical protein
MANVARNAERVFKTAWFSKAAKKVHLADSELCAAIRQVMLGQCDDLGGGVYKKRLGKNLYRSIVLARGGRYWVYEYLFAKNNQANIDDRQLANLKTLAATYASLLPDEVREILQKNEWVEICDGGMP